MECKKSKDKRKIGEKISKAKLIDIHRRRGKDLREKLKGIRKKAIEQNWKMKKNERRIKKERSKRRQNGDKSGTTIKKGEKKRKEESRGFPDLFLNFPGLSKKRKTHKKGGTE